MTVQDLIHHLGRYPRDAIVLFSQFSDYTELESDMITLAKADDPDERKRVARHKGHYMQYYHQWWKEIEHKEFVTAVLFPGN